MSEPFQLALPGDHAPDCGSKYRGGGDVLTFSLLGSIGAVLLLFGAVESSGPGVFLPGLVAGLLIGLLAARGWWCWFEARGHKNLPIYRDLLRKDLNFLIQHPMMDVAVTGFFRPEQAEPGNPTCLLIFLENYASRQRHVTLSLPANKTLGLPRSRRLRLALGAGQAAVYRLPLRVSAEAHSGEFDLKIRVIVKSVSGLGCRLPAYSGQKSRAPTTLFGVRCYLRPLLNVQRSTSGLGAPIEPLAAEAYFSLYVPALAQPRFELLGMISGYPPTREIVLSPGA
ncbi:MAG: hypothetical protein ABSE59_01705 [Opitutaceae bacterium]|jgi:hypothetical protein